MSRRRAGRRDGEEAGRNGSGAPRPFRLVLYNLRYGTGTGWRYHWPLPFSGCLRRTVRDFPRIEGFLEGLSADVLALVEVDEGSWRQEGRGQAKSLAHRIGGRPFFVCKYRSGSALTRLPLLGAQGNAVVSRLPVRGTRRHEFSRGVKRALLEVEFDAFTLLLVHLSLGAVTRRMQIEELAERIRGLGRPTLVAGDFNVYLGNWEVEALLEETGLRDANPERIPTYPRRTPRFALDRVLYGPGLRVERVAVLDAPYSDHLPLVVDFVPETSPAAPDRTPAGASPEAPAPR